MRRLTAILCAAMVVHASVPSVAAAEQAAYRRLDHVVATLGTFRNVGSALRYLAILMPTVNLKQMEQTIRRAGGTMESALPKFTRVDNTLRSAGLKKPIEIKMGKILRLRYAGVEWQYNPKLDFQQNLTAMAGKWNSALHREQIATPVGHLLMPEAHASEILAGLAKLYLLVTLTGIMFISAMVGLVVLFAISHVSLLLTLTIATIAASAILLAVTSGKKPELTADDIPTKMDCSPEALKSLTETTGTDAAPLEKVCADPSLLAQVTTRLATLRDQVKSGAIRAVTEGVRPVLPEPGEPAAVR